MSQRTRCYGPLVAVLTTCVPTFMFITAVGKLVSWSEFERSLDTYSLIPEWIRVGAAVAVPGAETAAFVLLVSGGRFAANGLSLILLVVFSAVTLWHWMENEPPECACLGLWADYFRLGESVRAVLIRNGILALLVVSAMLAHVRDMRRRTATAVAEEDAS
ncbi:MAG: hypothetical protein KAS72_10105 [Phycisphaerales bacterium]|nr:hypothetical protein [Phycisphaerales bacterium]